VTAQTRHRSVRLMLNAVIGAAFLAGVAGCASFPDAPTTPPLGAMTNDADAAYLIGPADQLSIAVWRQPDLSGQATVRPDGKISVPLIDDMPAAGRTPTELGTAIAAALKEYVQEPKVTVIVTGFVGPFDRQIRVLGEAARPQAIPFRHNMTILDVMIQVGGLTEFASGNRAVLTRTGLVRDGVAEPRQRYRLRLYDLLNSGDTDANAYVMPGDVIIIPQTYF